MTKFGVAIRKFVLPFIVNQCAVVQLFSLSAKLSAAVRPCCWQLVLRKFCQYFISVKPSLSTPQQFVCQISRLVASCSTSLAPPFLLWSNKLPCGFHSELPWKNSDWTKIVSTNSWISIDFLYQQHWVVLAGKSDNLYETWTGAISKFIWNWMGKLLLITLLRTTMDPQPGWLLWDGGSRVPTIVIIHKILCVGTNDLIWQESFGDSCVLLCSRQTAGRLLGEEEEDRNRPTPPISMRKSSTMIVVPVGHHHLTTHSGKLRVISMPLTREFLGRNSALWRVDRARNCHNFFPKAKDVLRFSGFAFSKACDGEPPQPTTKQTLCPVFQKFTSNFQRVSASLCVPELYVWKMCHCEGKEIYFTEYIH